MIELHIVIAAGNAGIVLSRGLEVDARERFDAARRGEIRRAQEREPFDANTERVRLFRELASNDDLVAPSDPLIEDAAQRRECRVEQRRRGRRERKEIGVARVGDADKIGLRGTDCLAADRVGPDGERAADGERTKARGRAAVPLPRPLLVFSNTSP